MTKVTFGNRQAKILCNLSAEARLDLIAEGLPIILESAEGFWSAAAKLSDQKREASVFAGFAEEEAAKILVLMDLVRCPPKRSASVVGGIVRTYYDHLARLIYADAQSWKPVDLNQLRQYVDRARQGHYLEGYAGEFIVPNWSHYWRESAMYADIETQENGQAHWNRPNDFVHIIGPQEPLALMLSKAMRALGMLDRHGLQAVADIWGVQEFKDVQGFEHSRQLTRALLGRLQSENLITAQASDDDFRFISGHWQMPMYNLEFRELPVDLDELKADREAQLWAEMGDTHY